MIDSFRSRHNQPLKLNVQKPGFAVKQQNTSTITSSYRLNNSVVTVEISSNLPKQKIHLIIPIWFTNYDHLSMIDNFVPDMTNH